MTNFVVWVEYWYNTSYHSVTHKTPFEVLYGILVPCLVNYNVGTAKNKKVEKK